jgi:hypothetical protein
MATLRVITQKEIEAWGNLLNNDEVKNARVDLKDRPEQQPPSKDSLLTALYKYIPATVIIGYTFLDAIFESMDPINYILWTAIFIILLAGAGVLTYRLTEEDPTRFIPESIKDSESVRTLIGNLQSVIDDKRLKQSVVAVIAFAGYVLAIGSLFAHIGCEDKQFCISFLPAFEWQAYYGAVALVLATLVVAILVGKDILAE